MSLLLFPNLSNSYSSVNMIRINHVVCRLYMNGKSSMVFNRNCFPKMKLKVRPLAGSHVHRKIGSISEEMVQDRHFVTTHH